MPKKKFEETAYDPFAALEARPQADGGVAEAAPETAPTTPRPTPEVVDMPRPGAPEQTKSERSQAEPPAFDMTKRFRVTEDEVSAYEELVQRLQRAARSKADFSVFARALWAVAQHGEAEILEVLKKSRLPRRPSKNDRLATAEYDALWTEVFITAFRKMPPPPK